MLIQLGDWELDVDVKTNMSFSVAQAQDNCRCAYCCNYNGAVDSAYPNLLTIAKSASCISATVFAKIAS